MTALALAIAATSTLGAADAAAQAEDRAAKQFDWGLSEMQAGRYATGCPALAESYRLDPRPGALFTLAECDNKWGKTATALAQYEAYLVLFGHMTDEQKRQQVGRDKIAATMRDVLVKDVPMLTVALPPTAPPGTVAARDGETLGSAAIGVPLAVDPGDHVLVLQTPDGRKSEQRVTLAPGRRVTVALDLPAAPPPAPPATTTAAQAPVAPPPDTGVAAGRPAPGRRVWIYVALGVGAVGVVAGTVGGFLALGEKSTIQRNCGIGGGDPHVCNAQGKSAADTGQAEALVSDIGFVVGAAGVAAALVLWLTEPRKAATGAARSWEPVVAGGSGGAMVGVRSRW